MTSKAIKISAGILVIMALNVFALQAQDQKSGQNRQEPPTIDEIFKTMDANKDEKLSLKEIKGPLKKDFKKIDTNKDGFLSREEIGKAPKPDRNGPPKNGNN